MFIRLATGQTAKEFLTQITLTYFVRGSITGRLTTCLTGLDSAPLLMMN